MTKARELVLAVLDAAAGPLSAAAVVEAVGGDCDQATVYRALHYLEGQGKAESFVLSCSAHGTERYYTSRSAPHRHWFHCEECHRFTDIGACTLDAMVSGLERKLGVEITGHTLYLMGICGDCRSAAAGRS
jgi:Fur family ferric uptake transcriptional regulator